MQTMQTIIKGVHLLTDVHKDDLIKLEDAAIEHYRKAFLSFRIIKIEGKDVVIRVTQGREATDYFTLKELINSVHEIFDSYLPDKNILVHGQPYKASPVEEVSKDWINKKLLEYGITLKQITEDTGLNKTYLSALINGGKSISQAMKAMFYCYFKFKEYEVTKATGKRKKQKDVA